LLLAESDLAPDLSESSVLSNGFEPFGDGWDVLSEFVFPEEFEWVDQKTGNSDISNGDVVSDNVVGDSEVVIEDFEGGHAVSDGFLVLFLVEFSPAGNWEDECDDWCV